MRTWFKSETAVWASVCCLLVMMAGSTPVAGDEQADKLDQAAIDARLGKGIGGLESLVNDAAMATAAGYELGLVHFENNQLAKAAPILKTALAATFPGPASGKDEAALTAALDQESDAAKARYELGLIYDSQGEVEQAAKMFRDAATIARAKGNTYVGLKKCKSCHFKQWKSWKKTKTAKSFDLLKSGVSSEEKTKLNFDPAKDYTADPACLDCHTTGYGMPGGYVVPAEGDAKADKRAKDNAGVTCEGCHGPGSKYVPVMDEIKKNKRQYKVTELREASLPEVDVRACTTCHSQRDPAAGPGFHFDYEKAKTEDTHDNIKLKYRMD